MKVAIIGAGWYGCHVALELKKKGYEVDIFEKNDAIFSGISGSYGIRLHRGAHYPRSAKTREICAENFDEFIRLYPELVIDHNHSYYALGEKDAHGNDPKVNADEFYSVCHETNECATINAKDTELKSIQSIYDIKEPSIALGNKLRSFFKDKLSKAQIPIHLNTNVEQIEDASDGVHIKTNSARLNFDFAVNATSFKELVPLKESFNLPVDVQVTYQVCLSLVYKDTKPDDKPFSFIVMDGWFPCVMPTVSDDNYDNTYILTHGCYTIMASCQTPNHAQEILDSYTDEYINDAVRKSTETDMKRYWPDFFERFKFDGWNGAVLAKPKTKSEFRSAITFAKGNVIHIIPGKVSNVINAANETLKLIPNNDCLSHEDIRYVKNGILDIAQTEIAEHPSPGDTSTTNINIIDSDKNQISARVIGRNSFFSPKPTTKDDSKEPSNKNEIKL